MQVSVILAQPCAGSSRVTRSCGNVIRFLIGSHLPGCPYTMVERTKEVCQIKHADHLTGSLFMKHNKNSVTEQTEQQANRNGQEHG